MTPEVWVALITVIGTAFNSFLIFLSRRDITRTRKASEKTEENTNHLKDELVAAVKEIAYGKGRKEGAAEEKARNA